MPFFYDFRRMSNKLPHKTGIATLKNQRKKSADKIVPVLSDITLKTDTPNEPLIPKSNRNIAGISVMPAK